MPNELETSILARFTILKEYFKKHIESGFGFGFGFGVGVGVGGGGVVVGGGGSIKNKKRVFFLSIHTNFN